MIYVALARLVESQEFGISCTWSKSLQKTDAASSSGVRHGDRRGGRRPTADGGSVAAEGGSAAAADGGGSGTGQQPPFCIQTLFKGLCLNRA